MQKVLCEKSPNVNSDLNTRKYGPENVTFVTFSLYPFRLWNLFYVLIFTELSVCRILLQAIDNIPIVIEVAENSSISDYWCLKKKKSVLHYKRFK